MASTTSGNGSGSNISRKQHGLNVINCLRRWNKAGKRGSLILCQCGVETDCLTSMTDENPGRRFRRCVNARKDRGCGHWKWVDPSMCRVAGQLIPLLRDKMIEMRNKFNVQDSVMRGYEGQIRKYKEQIVVLQNEKVILSAQLTKALSDKASWGRRLVCVVVCGLGLIVLISLLGSHS